MFPRRFCCQLLGLLIMVAIVAPRTAGADPAFSRSFNGPEIVWGILDNGTPSKVLAHDCVPGGARDNNGIERVLVAASAGQSVILACPTPPLAVVDELKIRLWVKSSRPDIQLAARIVLPRSLDVEKRGPASAIVKGAVYNRPGHWQELIVAEIPKLLASEVRVLRATPGSSIDSHEAYLDNVVLIIPGNPNGVEVGTDQLEVDGVQLDPNRITKAEAPSKSGGAPADLLRIKPAAVARPIALPGAQRMPAADENVAAVRMQGSTLLVDNRPFFPRAIVWNGEPLQYLAERGFNTIKLRSPPSDEQIAAAKRLMLWFISIPPRPDSIAQNGLGSRGDRVLAWSLEDDAIVADPDYALRWADVIRERDAVYGRPILVAPDSNWGLAGKCGDILLAYHPRGSRLSETEYAAWLAARPRLAKPGTPLWASIDTQFGEAVRQQVTSLTHQKLPGPTVDAEQLEMLLQTACTSGGRGIVFESYSSLVETDPLTLARAALLERLNRRLQVMEPWLAGGKVVSRASSTDSRYEAIVLHVDRARLLIPYETTQNKAPTSPRKQMLAKEVTFVVPGVSESSQAYYVTPVSLTAVATSRVAGGTSLSIPAASDGLVVVTEDPLVTQAIRQKVARQAPQLARLQRDFIVGRAQAIFEIDRRLAPLNVKPTVDATDATTMNSRLAQLDSLLTTGQIDRAQDAMTSLLADVRRTSLELRNSVGRTNVLSSDALALTYEHLAESAALQRSFENLRGGENLVAGGDFENLSEMTSAGWQHVVSPASGAATNAELSTAQPESGTYCLELRSSDSPQATPHDVADPRVWIISPAIPLDAGTTVEITGWVRVDQPFTTPGEGLAVADSLGGPELSIVVGDTSGWQMLRLVRAVPQPTTLHVTFALTGSGSAKVDAVMVRTLQQPVARRLPAPYGSGGSGH